MSLIKKIDVKKHFADRRRMRLAEARRVRDANASGSAGIEPSGTRVNIPGFAEDFSLEHSSPSVPTTPIGPIVNPGIA
jgi:hypothetical protein